MLEPKPAPEPFSLKRWSRRKLESARTPEPATAPVMEPTVVAPSPATPATTDASPVPQLDDVLPPVESLTMDSDFTPFFKPEVDAATQRRALKKLFSAPQFNVMDGLDVYVDDYTKADPMPAGMLDKLSAVYAMVSDDEPVPAAPTGDVATSPAALSAPLPTAAVEEGPVSTTPCANVDVDSSVSADEDASLSTKCS